MKRIIILSICLLLFSNLFSQIPKQFKYQAVVRDASGQILANKLISLKISILQDQNNGATVYSEIYQPYSTNEYGIVSVNVGTGDVISGNFNNIQWNLHTYYLSVELDITGQTDFVLMGTSQILAVPYALVAQDVVNNNDPDADPTNEIQDLQLADNVLSITNNPNATPISLSRYIGVDTDNQTLTISSSGNPILTISEGNSIPLDYVRSSGGTYTGIINATNIKGTGELTLYGNLILPGTSQVQFNTSGRTELNLPTEGTLATQLFVNQSITSSNMLPTGSIWIGVNGVATALPANGDGQILIGNGSGIGSFPIGGDASINRFGQLSLSSLHPTPTQFKIVNIDTKGRVVSGSNPTTLSGFGITDGLPIALGSGNIYIGNSSNIATQVTVGGDATLSNSGSLTLNSIASAGRYTRVNINAKGQVTFGDNPTTLNEMGILDGLTRSLNNRNILIGDANGLATQVIIGGDATLANDGTLTLANTLVTAPGPYHSVTVDSKGRVIAGTNPTTLAGFGIGDAMHNSHAANGITATNISNWNAASGWGDHHGLYLSTTYVPDWSVISNKPTTFAGYGVTTGSLTRINITEVLNLQAAGAPPSVPNNGDIYLNTDGFLYYYLNGWHQLSRNY